MKNVLKYYPACRRFLVEKFQETAAGSSSEGTHPSDLPNLLSPFIEDGILPPFLSDLARLEWLIHIVSTEPDVPPANVKERQVNPSLTTVELNWLGLLDLAGEGTGNENSMPEPGRELILLWRMPGKGELRSKIADEEDLLVLKIVLEDLSAAEVAEAGNVPVLSVEQALERSARQGIIQSPGSLLQRDEAVFPENCKVDRDRFHTSQSFALQWHLTQACDLHCRHCYDRSNRDSLDLKQAEAILDQLDQFCRQRNVRGGISFSGGNPLLYLSFFELYRNAHERGFQLAILGNPTSRENLEKLVEIARPVHYQVSLEGLHEHNDYIRGDGHFARVMEFLELLKKYEIYSMVMLTLTKDNIGQVLPLVEELRDRVDSFTFNRLSMVGEGAALQSADPEGFREFLLKYINAAKGNEALRLKDNLFNIIRQQSGRGLLRGCAGYGCGAAFNFLTVLPDGEVHACRKFPSPVGNILERDLGEIYDSAAAQRYRQGSAACKGCPIRPTCGGCQAVVYGMGLDPAIDRDPYCFIDY